MKKYLLILAAFCFVTFWGCSESPEIEDDPTEQTPDGGKTETPKIEFDSESDTEPEIEAEGGETDVTFTATADWSADVAFTRAEQWCTVYPASGNAGTATVTISVEPNETAEERSATVTIKCGESAAITVTVTQAGIDNSEKPMSCNEIRYTSSDGKIVEITAEHPFGEGVSIVSNVYENGVGIITCDGDITTIAEFAFCAYSSLTSITIPDSVTDIGAYAFAFCQNLKSVVLPKNLTTLENDIFHSCSSLDNIVIPDSVTTIGARAFMICTELTNITIPDNVTAIGTGAFIECTKLTNITIPANVTVIGLTAFWECTGLTAIYCKGNIPAQLSKTEDNYYKQFEDTNKAPIYVPAEAVDIYRNAEGWNQYATRIKGYDFTKGEEVETSVWPVLKWSRHSFGGDNELYEEDGCVRSYYTGFETTILVESNSDWVVEKENPSDDWFSVDQTSFSGPEDRSVISRYFLKIKIDEYAGSTLRKGALILKTIPREADEAPTESRILLKQASKNPTSQVLAENLAINGMQRIQTGIKGGRYDFEVIGNNNVIMNFYFYADKIHSNGDTYQIRYWTSSTNGMYDGVPIMSTMPWMNDPFNMETCGRFADNYDPGTYARIDKSQKHTLSLDIQKAEIDNVTYNKITWYIDGEIIQLGNGTQRGELITSLSANSGPTFELTYSELCSPGSYIAANGTFTILSYTFTPSTSWE